MLRCASLTKTYLSGGRRLTVLKDITFRWSRARSSPSSAPPAAARRRCSASSPGSTGPPPAPCISTARISARSTRTSARGSAARRSGSCSSRSSSSRPSPRARTCRSRSSSAARRPPPAPASCSSRVGLGDRGHHYPGPALGRRAAAGGARPRVQHPAQGAVRRRAHRQSRRRHRRHDHRPHDRAQPGPGHHAGPGDARSRSRRAAPGARSAWPTAPSSPTARREGRLTAVLFVLRMAAREIRAAPRRLLLLTASIAIGVAALVAIDCFTDNLRDSVRSQARALLGADLALSSRRPLPRAAEAVLDTLTARGGDGRPAHQLLRDGLRAAHERHPAGAGGGGRGRLPVLRRDPHRARRRVARARRRGTGSWSIRRCSPRSSARVGDTLSLGEAPLRDQRRRS